MGARGTNERRTRVGLFGNNFGNKQQKTGVYLKTKKTDCYPLQLSVMMLVENMPAIIEFAKQTQVEDAIEFMKFVETYRTMIDETERKQLAMKIWIDFVKAGASKEANLSGKEREEIQKHLSQGEQKLFNQAYSQVMMTLTGQLQDSTTYKHWVTALKKAKFCPVCKPPE
jgi:hypothetical protein